MVNFLSKFLSRKSPEEESGTETPAQEQSAEEIAAVAADEAPQSTMSAMTMPERPMYDASIDAAEVYASMTEMEEFEATTGESLPPGSEIADEDDLVEAMRTVYDPEIPVNIYDLGLIYTVDIKDDGDVNIEMSLTAPGCPVAGEMPGMVANAVTQVEGTGVVTVRIVWEPQWTMDRMSEDAKLALGMI